MKNAVLRAFLIALVPCLLVGYMTWITTRLWLERRYYNQTLTQAHTLSVAFSCYAQAHQGHLPSAYKWEDELRPYVGTQPGSAIANIPTVPGQTPKRFAMNSALSEKSVQTLPKANEAIILFVTDGTVRNTNRSVPPLAWRGQPYDVVGFADGHIQQIGR